jgi:hypothetical protein
MPRPQAIRRAPHIGMVTTGMRRRISILVLVLKDEDQGDRGDQNERNEAADAGAGKERRVCLVV